ncbi:hypothetical protein QOZ96_002731 [Brevundimonas nasdae]|jgi:Protease inhibitor Inh|uniref:AprI/Inh family metalloprotease inhibitor n=1 Tax=Brevundimonas nasdae TaxID=172043 RepID=UPI0019144BC7|nr:AprI/Inh family metalloprotease inhibitor [Brevundimonas nasdae]MBK6026126.1 AprI/Inh family metalloprotease inhibitor [Brevundimonas nasdae]MDQ0452775.1 hypothetical protein [Brevundimonas nasdae]
MAQRFKTVRADVARAWLAAVVLCAVGLANCSPSKQGEAQASESTKPPLVEVAAAPVVQEAPIAAWGNDDPDHPQPDPSPLGDFVLWEDREGGRVCPVELENARTIGGYSFVYDEECLDRLGIADPYAWFAADDGSIVLIDVTRHVLLRLTRHRKDEYYAERQAMGLGLENLNLTRP